MGMELKSGSAATGGNCSGWIALRPTHWRNSSRTGIAIARVCTWVVAHADAGGKIVVAHGGGGHFEEDRELLVVAQGFKVSHSPSR